MNFLFLRTVCMGFIMQKFIKLFIQNFENASVLDKICVCSKYVTSNFINQSEIKQINLNTIFI